MDTSGPKAKLSPHEGGCWYCEIFDEDIVFSQEFDANVHLKCVLKALEKDPHDEEALIMARELGLPTESVRPQGAE